MAKMIDKLPEYEGEKKVWEYLSKNQFDTTTGMMILEEAPLPAMVPALGVDNIVKIWREHKVRGKGASLNRAKTLVDAAHDSVGKSCLRT